MKMFYHFNPTTVDEAVSLLQEHENAVVNAGGTDLFGIMKDYALPTQPAVLVNLKRIPGLAEIEETAEGLKIGALTTLTDIVKSSVVKAGYPMLAEAADAVASPQLRNVGTIGGNVLQLSRCQYYRVPDNKFFCLKKGGLVCYAIAGRNEYHSIFGGPAGCYQGHPSDIAPALIALNASAVTNTRTISFEEFFIDLDPGSVLEPDEILTAIQIPAPAAGKQVFLKYAMRKAFDHALVSVAAFITPATGTVTDARIVLGSVAPTPHRSTAAEDALKGQAISASRAEAAASAAVATAAPLTLNSYKVSIAKALVKRAILA